MLRRPERRLSAYSPSPCANKLERILFRLSHLNLEDDIVDKQPHVSGLGGSCDIYSAWSKRHNKKVAIKQMRVFLKKDVSLAKKLAKEIRIWAKLNHANVLPLLGYFTEGDGVMPALVAEWMEKGTLKEFMVTFPRACLLTCLMLRGIASGLAYLHSKKVIHADLKSNNILISANNEPLIADFGLSLALSQCSTASASFENSAALSTSYSVKGTVRWMAKELLVPEEDPDASIAKYNEATDMWGFGMVVYELLTWKVPFWDKTRDIFVLMAILNGELPAKPKPDTSELCNARVFDILWEICEYCWKDVEARPSAQDVLDELSAEYLNSSAPVNVPNSFSTEEDWWIDSMPAHSANEYFAMHTTFKTLVWHGEHTCSVEVSKDSRKLIFDCGLTLGPVISIEVKDSGGANDDLAISGFPFPIELVLWSWVREDSGVGSLVFSEIVKSYISLSSVESAHICWDALTPSKSDGEIVNYHSNMPIRRHWQKYRDVHGAETDLEISYDFDTSSFGTQ